MSKKAKIIVIVACVAGALLTALVAAFVVREWLFSREYGPGGDEFALFFVLDTEEDVGLIVFDYNANGRDFSGGVSNADRTPLKKGEVVIDTRSREELGCEGTTVRLTYELRIITEYVDRCCWNRIRRGHHGKQNQRVHGDSVRAYRRSVLTDSNRVGGHPLVEWPPTRFRVL